MKTRLIAAALAGTMLAGTAIAQGAAAQPAPGAAPGSAQRTVRAGAADANGDGILTRAEMIAAADARFARLDADRDGRLTTEERGGRARDGEPVTRAQFRERVAARFDRADANRDGRIEQSERAGLRGDRAGRGHGRADRRGGPDGMAGRGPDGMRHGGMGRGMGRGMGQGGLMRLADANRDGVLTRAELTTAAQAMFDRLDTNRDGRLDRAEQSAARERAGMRRGGGGPRGPMQGDAD